MRRVALLLTVMAVTLVVVNGVAVAVSKEGTDGDDTLRGTPEADKIRGLSGNDTLIGRGGNDTVYGNQGMDTIYGGHGEDSLRGERGADSIVGGTGEDTIYIGTGYNQTIEVADGETDAIFLCSRPDPGQTDWAVTVDYDAKDKLIRGAC